MWRKAQQETVMGVEVAAGPAVILQRLSSRVRLKKQKQKPNSCQQLCSLASGLHPKRHILYILYIYDMWVSPAPGVNVLTAGVRLCLTSMSKCVSDRHSAHYVVQKVEVSLRRTVGCFSHPCVLFVLLNENAFNVCSDEGSPRLTLVKHKKQSLPKLLALSSAMVISLRKGAASSFSLPVCWRPVGGASRPCLRMIMRGGVDAWTLSPRLEQIREEMKKKKPTSG